jgi:hypothetical protein
LHITASQTKWYFKNSVTRLLKKQIFGEKIAKPIAEPKNAKNVKYIRARFESPKHPPQSPVETYK